MNESLRAAALAFHEHPRPGKIALAPSKALTDAGDLSLAYSPGVAAPCEEIARDPALAYRYTSKGNLVAVVSNGTAVLGLGNIGALASKPVMEGKSVLFKHFGGVDSIDLEVNETDPMKFVDIVAALEPTFGGINLEDIKAPDCFVIEAELKARMQIPVFHDDQHGTAIIVAAAALNGLELAGKDIAQAKICCSGAGAAAIACMNMLISVGARRENIFIADRQGIVTKARQQSVDPWRGAFAQETELQSLDDVMINADVYVGLSSAGALKPHALVQMAASPLILALSNPVPEIMPELALAVRPDALICTGRSDFPNQVNNVLCFPFLFRGALDCAATEINEEMKLAAVRAICALTKETGISKDYLIPSPFDPRLVGEIAPAVAEAATRSGAARLPIEDSAVYKARLTDQVVRLVG
ncbi:malic enzyme [Rhizobium sp. BK060]|nr:malic enzyme [Rhizobium sp. BK060]